MAGKRSRLTPERFEHLEPYFRRASELDVEARNIFLATLPKEDRDEIESLIAFDRPDDRIPMDDHGLPSLPNVRGLLGEISERAR